MNKNVIIVLGGALAVAIVVAVLVQVSLGGKKQQVVQEAKVEVLVAAKDLGIGQELKEGDTRWQEWSQSSVFPGAVVRANNEEAAKVLVGRLARNIGKGEPVMKNAMLGESKGNFVAASLEPGQRAVAIQVSAATMVGGFISPGDYVDLILTYQSRVATDDDDPRVQAMMELNLEKVATETIMQNLKVLAVDQSAKPTEEEKIKVGKTVTLAMTAEQAEKVALAQEMGEITLALRGVGDDKIFEKTWQTASDARLISIDDEVFTEYKKIKKGAGISSGSMRIYNGANVTAAPAD